MLGRVPCKWASLHCRYGTSIWALLDVYLSSWWIQSDEKQEEKEGNGKKLDCKLFWTPRDSRFLTMMATMAE